MARRSSRRTVTISPKKKGQKPMKFQAGALHRALGVPMGQPIPASKKRAALAGRYGAKNKKRANFAFRGALAAGRKTASKRRRKKRTTKKRTTRKRTTRKRTTRKRTTRRRKTATKRKRRKAAKRKRRK